MFLKIQVLVILCCDIKTCLYNLVQFVQLILHGVWYNCVNILFVIIMNKYQNVHGDFSWRFHKSQL